MQYRLVRKKYKSLVISCIIHGLILLVLMYYTLRQIQQDASEPLKQLMPAPVSIQSRQKRILPFQSAETEVQDDTSLPYGEQLEQYNTLESPYQEILPPNEEQQETAQEDIENLPLVTQTTPQGDLPTNEVTITDVMRAFRSAIKQDRPPAASNDPQTFVQQRLGRQWGQASYAGRVAQALNRAFRIHARTIRHDEYINRRIRLSLIVLKDGSPGDLGDQELSGIPEVDRHIRHVVKQAHFPPIPERFNQESYHLPIALQIVLKDGAIMFGKNYEVTEK